MNTSVKFLVVLVFGVLCLVPWPGPLQSTAVAAGTSSPDTTGAIICAGERLAVQNRLAHIFANRQTNGDIRFQGADSVLYYHPLLATFALESYRGSGDLAFLQQAHDVLKGYFNYLFVHHDTDGDFLVERSSTIVATAPDLEDVGFNAMLALDMLSLSAICLELKMPIDALYWYQGVRTINKQLIATSFDSEAYFFLPTRANTHRRESLYFGLSALPVYFSQGLGDNISKSVIRNYLLNDQILLPETPSHYLTGHFTANELAVTNETTRAVRTRLLLGALERSGFGGELAPPSTLYQAAEANNPDTTSGMLPGDVLGEYTRCVLAGGGTFAPFPQHLELDILDTIVFQKSLLDASATAELRRAIADVRGALDGQSPSGPDGSATDPEAVMMSIRRVYFAISSLRDKWKNRTLFNQNENSNILGFDIYGAMSDLWDDTVVTLRKAEDTVTARRLSIEGVNFTAILLKESVAPGEPVPVRFAVSTLTKTVAIRSIVVMTDQGIDTLLNADPPLEISPSDTVYSFPYSYSTVRAPELAIHPFVLSAEIRFADGSSAARRHFNRGVFVTKPVTFVVRFPNGMSLTEGIISVEIDVKKHRPFVSMIQARWFSPVGLKPVEGPAIEIRMPAHEDELTLQMNIPVPTPCRPGSFPFTLRVLSNGEEVGTISSHFFKHYRWLYVGPFAEKLEGLDARYAPESRIQLLHTYPGAHRQVRWQQLSSGAYADEGRIVLDPLLPTGSVGFLYTVIETAGPKTTTVFFGASSPALLYVNGDPLIRIDPDDRSPLKHTRVALKQGMNDVLIKTISREQPVVFFQLGDEEDLASDEFNNNLWELVDGYAELVRRDSEHHGESDQNTRQSQRQVTLTYSDSQANSVSVVGSFNGWSPANSNMRKNNLGQWEISLYLSPGRYAYRFLVNNSLEVLDPTSPDEEPDGYGGHNSVLYVK